ncbi:MAG: hypothetical protein ACI4JB_01075 [Porcipelethomonas sp.]
MKKCKYCERELHENSSFCPYCMKGQTERQGTAVRRRNPAAVIISFAVIVAVVSIILIMAGGGEKSSVNSAVQSEVSEEETYSDAVTQTEQTIDYPSYIGTWLCKEADGYDDITENGGSAVRIFSIDDRIAEIALTTVQSPPASRIATTDKVYGEVSGNVISFHFQNDGWMSGGDGTITLLEDAVYAEVIYTYKDPSAMWALDHSDIFYKDDN